MQLLTLENSKNSRKSFFNHRNKRFIPLYVMLIPGILYFVLFRYFPMYGILMAFKDLQVTKGILQSPWINPWYENFRYFFNSSYAVPVIVNTLLISIYKLIVSTPFSVIIAVFLNEVQSKYFKKAVQTATFMPYFLSWVVVYGIFQLLFSETDGIINYIIRDITGTSFNFLANNELFRGMIVASNTWKMAGYGAVIYLAAIVAIDQEQYEAARIDGATRFQCVIHITLANIYPVIIMMTILNVGYIMDAGFEHLYIFQNPMVLKSGDILDTYVFRVGLQDMRLGLGSAIGIFKSLIGCFLVFTVNRLSRKVGGALW